MVVASNVTPVKAGRLFFTLATLTFSGNYVAGGDVLNLVGGAIHSNKAPVFVVIQGDTGYTYTYVNGTDLSNGLIRVFQPAGAAAPAAELPVAAYPAAIPTDVVQALIVSF